MLYTGYWRRPWREYFTERHVEYLGRDLCCMVTTSNPPTEDEVGCPVYELSESHGIASRGVRKAGRLLGRDVDLSRRRFVSILRRERPDQVLFEYGTNGSWLGDLCAARDIPFAVHFHGFDLALDDPTYWERAHRILPRASLLIGNSANSARLLVEAGFPEELVKVKYMGVPVAAQPVPLPLDERLRIAFVANMFEGKGPLLCLQAFAQARTVGLEAELHMVGDGPLLGACRDYVRVQSIVGVVFHGNLDNDAAREVMRDCHLFTQHSRRPGNNWVEGFGLSVAEAMAEGRAVVVSDYGALPELVVDGVTGALFAENDWRAQGAAIAELGRDSPCLASYGVAGHRRALELFSDVVERRRLRELLGLDAAVQQAMPRQEVA
jgi:glycosyltransferase involved in cell wall biosynthesis